MLDVQVGKHAAMAPVRKLTRSMASAGIHTSEKKIICNCTKNGNRMSIVPTVPLHPQNINLSSIFA